VFRGRCLICVFMDPARILVWNVRGLNSTSRQDAVRPLVKLQELTLCAKPKWRLSPKESCSLCWAPTFLVMLNSQLRGQWGDPNVLLQSAATSDSDHCPLLLGLKDNKVGKRRFHFEAFWPKLEGFHEAVEQAWQSVQPRVCPLLNLHLKFRAVAKGLQAWSDKEVGHVESQVALAREVLHQLEIAQDSQVLIHEETMLRNMLKKQTLVLASLQRTIARLRSRIGWLKEGDANTNFFHTHARHRKRKNFIAKLVADSVVCTSHEDKSRAVDDFYIKLLGTTANRAHSIDLQALGIPSHDLADLDAPFSEKEVWETIKQLPSDKAPGPIGFTGGFYKACWPIIKQDMMRAVSAIWSRRFRNFDKLNSAYITLIPKVVGADQVKDFRPISLVHSFAKLITKLLSNRLAGKLNEMVSPNQSAFTKGRFTQDNFMLVQQTARFLHQRKQSHILFKLDISKAFDSVSWPFLLEVMQHLGFGQIWRDIISGLLGSASTKILVNGIPSDTILHQRGLWQGDPLSSMLFILAMDALGFVFAKAENDDLLQPLSIRMLHHRVSLYADDVVLFLSPVEGDIYHYEYP
jgi:hypothetical protein